MLSPSWPKCVAELAVAQLDCRPVVCRPVGLSPRPECGPKNIKNFHFLVKSRPLGATPLTDFENFWGFYTPNCPTLVFQISCDSHHRLRSSEVQFNSVQFAKINMVLSGKHFRTVIGVIDAVVAGKEMSSGVAGMRTTMVRRWHWPAVRSTLELPRLGMLGRQVKTGVWQEPRHRYWRPSAVTSNLKVNSGTCIGPTGGLSTRR